MSWREDASLGKTRVRSLGYKEPNIEDMGAAQKVLYTYSPRIQSLDPGGGAVDLLLPPEADSVGQIFYIANNADAAEAITVKEDSDTTTILTLAQNENGIVWCDGVAWHGIKA